MLRSRILITKYNDIYIPTISFYLKYTMIHVFTSKLIDGNLAAKIL